MHLHLLKNFFPVDRVHLHEIPFFGSELSLLIENGLRHFDLTDVVQSTRHCGHRDLSFRHRVLIGDFPQLASDHPHGRSHVHHMQTAFLIAHFNDVAQDVDHHARKFLFLVDLVGKKLRKMFLSGVEVQRIDDAALHHDHVKGALQIVGRPELIGRMNRRRIQFRGNDDDRHRLHVIIPHPPHHLHAVHHRHVDVE